MMKKNELVAVCSISIVIACIVGYFVHLEAGVYIGVLTAVAVSGGLIFIYIWVRLDLLDDPKSWLRAFIRSLVIILPIILVDNILDNMLLVAVFVYLMVWTLSYLAIPVGISVLVHDIYRYLKDGNWEPLTLYDIIIQSDSLNLFHDWRGLLDIFRSMEVSWTLLLGYILFWVINKLVVWVAQEIIGFIFKD